MKRMNPFGLRINHQGQAHLHLLVLLTLIISAIIIFGISLKISGDTPPSEYSTFMSDAGTSASPDNRQESLEPTPERTAGPTPLPSPSPTPISTPTLTPTPTLSPAPATSSADATDESTAEPTAAPALTSAPTPTVKPTATPTAKPTPTPTVKPTATPAPTPTRAPTPTPTPTPTPVAKDQWTPAEWRAELFRLTNIERTKEGVPVLQMGSSGLLQAAGIRAEEITTSFSHTRPDGTLCFTALAACQVSYRTTGENIAMATAGYRSPAEVMQMWMDSPGHRNNILKASFTSLGIGYSCANGYEYFVQMFVG